MAVPSWLQHLHGTVHGYWYYGCDCYRCYAKQASDCGNAVMSAEEWEGQEREFERVQAMSPEDRKAFFANESHEMMRRLEGEIPWP